MRVNLVTSEIIKSFVIASLCVLFIELVLYFVNWNWIRNHPNQYGLHGCIIAIVTSLILGWRIKPWRSICLTVGAIPALYVMFQILGGPIQSSLTPPAEELKSRELISQLNQRAEIIVAQMDEDYKRLQSRTLSQNRETTQQDLNRLAELEACKGLFTRLQKEHVDAIRKREIGRIIELTRQLQYLQLTRYELKNAIEKSGTGGYALGVTVTIPNDYPGLPPDVVTSETLWPPEARQREVTLDRMDDNLSKIRREVKSLAASSNNMPR